MTHYMNVKLQKVKELHDSLECEFVKTEVSSNQSDAISNVEKILKVLDVADDSDKTKTFLSWTGEQLINAECKLSRYSEIIGDEMTHHESLADFTYTWRKGVMANDWQPIKTKLKQETPKITNPEIESELTAKYLTEQFYGLFHRRRADMLKRKVESMDRMLRTISHRLRELDREARMRQD